jgi:hypothetical protein
MPQKSHFGNLIYLLITFRHHPHFTPCTPHETTIGNVKKVIEETWFPGLTLKTILN